MILTRVDHARRRKPRNQQNLCSNSNLMARYHSQHSGLQPSMLSNANGLSESRKSQSRKPKNMNTFMLEIVRRLGCKGAATPVLAPTVKRSPAEGETRQKRKKNQRRKATCRANSPVNLVDIPDICCTPPGISYVSDVVPMPSMNAHRMNRIQNCRVARRITNIQNISVSVSEGSSGTILTRNHASNDRYYHHFRQEISQLARSLEEYDQHREWRLDVDSMSYEELLDLSEKIGYVQRGLRKEQILRCLTIIKLSKVESLPLLMSTDKDWKCSICQEGCRKNDEVGRLGCGHYHHIDCIRQWLLEKNECPVCKFVPVADK